MGQFAIILESNAEKELKKHLKTSDKATIKRIDQIFEELKVHPKIGIGKPEALKHNLSGYWSRRINKKDRLIYKVDDEIVTIFIISAMGHYSDK